jgi:RNA polymerase sigma-70 factor (ECF subfamily)
MSPALFDGPALDFSGAPALDLRVCLGIMPSLKRRSASLPLSPRAKADASPKQGDNIRVRADSVEPSAPTAETLKSWLQAVARTQDRASFARLHGFFAPRLTAWLSRTGLPPVQIEDIVQETMIAIWRKAGLYDAKFGGVSTWVFVIARNQRVDYLRRKQNRVTQPLEDWDPIDDSPGGEESLLAAERDLKVRKALAQLTREQASVLEQAYFAEKPHSAIARDLGIPLGTVKSRMRLALARLRSLLEESP